MTSARTTTTLLAASGVAAAAAFGVWLLRGSKKADSKSRRSDAESKKRRYARAKFVLFGDSITQYSFDQAGWGASLAHTWQRHADVVLRGFSGYNTRFALCLLRQTGVLRDFRGARLCTVFFGANDAADGALSIQHVPLDEYERNLVAIVRLIQEAAAEDSSSGNSSGSGDGADALVESKQQQRAGRQVRIVVITPPPIDEEAWGKHCKERGKSVSDRRNELTGQYAAAAQRAAKTAGVHCLDVYGAMHKAGRVAGFLSDGLHLSSAGNLFVSKILHALIQKEFPELGTRAVGLDAPLWTDVDPKAPSKAFEPASS